MSNKQSTKQRTKRTTTRSPNRVSALAMLEKHISDNKQQAQITKLQIQVEQLTEVVKGQQEQSVKLQRHVEQLTEVVKQHFVPNPKTLQMRIIMDEKHFEPPELLKRVTAAASSQSEWSAEWEEAGIHLTRVKGLVGLDKVKANLAHFRPRLPRRTPSLFR